MICYNCQTEIPLEAKVTRNATCPKCLAYLHCCRNCRFYDPNAHNQCREPQAEWVKDKEAANYCDFFEPGAVGNVSRDSRKEAAKKNLDDLFKKK